MNKTVLTSFTILCLLFTVFLMGLALDVRPVKAEPKTWTVDDDGPADFHTIQEAINAASPRDTIFVYDGTYYENVVVNKTVSLVGENRSTTRIEGSCKFGVIVVSANDVTLSSFTIITHAPDRSYAGLYLNGTNYCNITDNTISRPHYSVSIRLDYSSNNYLSQNIVQGIFLQHSSNNILSQNNIRKNSEHGAGIALSYSSSNIISQNNIEENAGQGIMFYYSLSNVINENNLANNGDAGLGLYHSSNNMIRQNNLARNSAEGIMLDHSRGNVIKRNNLTENYYGVTSVDSFDNVLSQNNFVYSYYWQVDITQSINCWDSDYPSGGNYWSDYAGVDEFSGTYQNETGADGIIDIPYTIDIDNVDRYPLIRPIRTFNAGTWNDVSYSVDVVSNSTISDFYFNPDEGVFLRFNVTGEDGTAGFCRVTIPKDLLWVEDGWAVFVGGKPIIDYRIIPDENYTYMYFTYNHSTKMVQIKGTHAIPEFPSSIIMLLFMIATLLGVTVYRKKQQI